MIKTFEEFVNEGLLDIFTGDGCKNLETICSAFAKRLSSIDPIKYKYRPFDGDKVLNGILDYSKELRLQYISADDDLVIDSKGKRTIKQEARRMATQFKEDILSSDRWADEEKCFKEITRFLYKSNDLNAFNDFDVNNKSYAIFTFSIPYLVPVKDEKDIYERKLYYYTTFAPIRVNGKDDKKIANSLLNSAFLFLYKGLTDPENELIEYTDSTDMTFKDIRKYIPSVLIDAVKKATKRNDLK